MSTQSAARVVPNAEKEGGSKSKKALMRQNYPIRYLLPAYIMLLIFFFVPTILNLIYAFTNWSAYSKTINFVGFSNFIELFKSGNLLRDLRITLIYALLVAIFQILSDYCWLSFLRKIRESIDLLVRCSSFRSSCRHSL